MSDPQYLDCPRCAAEKAVAIAGDLAQHCSNLKCLAVIAVAQSENGHVIVHDTRDTYLTSDHHHTVLDINWSNIRREEIADIDWDKKLDRDHFYDTHKSGVIDSQTTAIVKPSIVVLVLTVLSTYVLASSSTLYVSGGVILAGALTIFLHMRPMMKRKV